MKFLLIPKYYNLLFPLVLDFGYAKRSLYCFVLDEGSLKREVKLGEFEEPLFLAKGLIVVNIHG